MEEELNNRWGSAFNVFQNPDIKAGFNRATATNALSYPTVFACINVLSDDIAKLPFKTYKKNEKGEISQVKDNDVHYVLRVRPNRYMTPFTFIKCLVTDVCINGNFYAYVVRDNYGKIQELIPLTSQLTAPVIDSKSGDIFYKTNYRGENIHLYSDEVIHIKGMSKNGVIGLSPIEAIRVQLESNDIGSKFNKDMLLEGGTPKGILKVTGNLAPESKKVIRESWNQTNANKSIAIVDNGMEYQQVSLNQSDMQWLETMKFNQQQIASIFKVPMHKINELDKATYSNIEHQSLDYVKNTIQPWVTQIEEEFGFKLYTEDEQKNDYYVKFNMDSELRGDSESRAKVNQMNFQNGFKTINEVRASNEDSPIVEDFADEPMVTLNVAPARNIHVMSNNNFGKHLQGGTQDEQLNDNTDNGSGNLNNQSPDSK